MVACLGLATLEGQGADQPQWGEAWSRNMVSGEKKLPEFFDPVTGTNVKWTARLGTQTHSTPIVACGRVYIGTNNNEPRDSRHKGDRGVLMCFEEKSGKFLWQLLVPKRDEDRYYDWPETGISSPVTVDNGQVYVVSNRGEVICLDPKGMENGNQGPFMDEATHMTPGATSTNATDPASMEPGPMDADILWLFDLPTGAGIWPHDAAHSSILVHGDYLFLNTGTGVDNTHKKIRTPDAPSVIVLDKKTGRLIARDHERIAPEIFHATWSSPSLGTVAGRPLLFFGGGNGVLYAFDATLPDKQLQTVWTFDFDSEAPRTNVHRYNSNRSEGPSNFYGMPVFYKKRVYAAGGGDLWWGKNAAWLKCIDPSRTGDVTTNGLIWSYALQKHVLGTPAIQDGLIFIADCGRTFHCINAETGKAEWTHDITGEVWASPLLADGKVYLGTRSGAFYIFEASGRKKLLATIELRNPISATATAANGVLYVATMTQLYALGK